MVTRRWPLILLAIAASVAASPAQAGEKARMNLSPTGIEARARGKAIVTIDRGSAGRFEVSVQRLAGETDYDLIVGGIKVLTLQTRRGGSAKARFRTAPRGSDTVLGFDPRGQSIALRGPGGDVLVGTMPAPASDEPDDMACCLPDDSGTECEDRTAEECAALGGVATGASSCMPDPCGTAPPIDRDVVCCTPDHDGPECEDRTQAECLAEGGSIVEATSCDPNPCVGTVPTPTVTPAATATPGQTAPPTPTATPAAPTPAPTAPPATPAPTPTSSDPVSCEDGCWIGFLACVNGCTSTYCAPFCQVDLGYCLDACPG